VNLGGIGTTEIVIIGVLVIVEFGLLAWALLDIIKRPESQITGGKKWVWILVVALFNVIGPIVYLLAGRSREIAADAGTGIPGGEATRAAVDSLYGPGSEESGR
jgi:hypothetical protein